MWATSLQDFLLQRLEEDYYMQVAERWKYLLGLAAAYCLAQLLIVGAGLIVWVCTDKENNLSRMWADARRWFRGLIQP